MKLDITPGNYVQIGDLTLNEVGADTTATKDVE